MTIHATTARRVHNEFRTSSADRLRRTDHLAFNREAADKRLVEALEQLDVLCFLAGEVQDRPDPPVITKKMWTRMVDHERKNELFHHPEDTKILVRADMVQNALLERVQGFDRRRASKALGHEIAREVEFLVFPENVIELPLCAKR